MPPPTGSTNHPQVDTPSGRNSPNVDAFISPSKALDIRSQLGIASRASLEQAQRLQDERDEILMHISECNKNWKDDIAGGRIDAISNPRPVLSSEELNVVKAYRKDEICIQKLANPAATRRALGSLLGAIRNATPPPVVPLPLGSPFKDQSPPQSTLKSSTVSSPSNRSGLYGFSIANQSVDYDTPELNIP
jgi:hypothetical protein